MKAISMTDHVKITDSDATRLITLNRMDKKNALTVAMYSAMADAVNDANANPAIRCILFTGSDTTFTAGGDLGDFLTAAESGAPLMPDTIRFLHSLAHNEKPVVAAVEGYAVGIGTTMLFHCDVVTAGRAAKFVTPFSSLGLLPEAGSSLLAPQMFGMQRAFKMLVMGHAMDANEAKATGLVSDVVNDGEALACARERAIEITRLPPESVKIARRLIRGNVNALVARIDDEAEHFRARLCAPETLKALREFASARKS